VFLDRAYISAEKFFNLPVNAVFGKQGCKIGEGLLVNDNTEGLSGITLDIALPFGFKSLLSQDFIQ